MTITIRLAAVIALIALAGCHKSSGGANASSADAAIENVATAKLSLTSDAFNNGQPVPPKYTCDGGDRTPILHWSDPPPGSKSFALVIDDPDAPGGTFRHWGVYDIPASARSIGGAGKLRTEVVNGFGKLGYGGPCPPRGGGPHHYQFKLFALNVERLGLRPTASVADVENAASAHAVAAGELVGTYERH